MSLYVIPDIHGHKDQLHRALRLMEADGGHDAPLIVLGDLVDRGPDSRGVIDTLMAGQRKGRDWTVLRGNHDQLFIDFLSGVTIDSPFVRSGKSWLHPRMGGAETLASYGIAATEDAPNLRAAQASVPQDHVDFLGALPHHHLVADLLFVHAGIDPRVPLEWQSERDMLWIRDPFLNHTGPLPWLVVHGHTAIEHPAHHGNRINLDGGAGWGRTLHVAVFEGHDCWLLTDRGRVPLRP